MDERLERQARNEALFREVNDRIAELGEEAQAGWAPMDGQIEFFCECGREGGCGARVAMTPEEYALVRGESDRFATAAGHHNPALERVVAQTARFVIVDKIPAAEPLVAEDGSTPG
jgi:hypothetical protein